MKHKLWIAVFVFLLDRLTKILSVRLPDAGIILIPGILGLRPTRNTGIAFSLFSGRPWLLGLMSLIAIVTIVILIHGISFSTTGRIGLMLMLGGAVGNLVDRFFTGYVPDMIELLFVHFAIFNIADLFLCIGCGLVILSLLFRKEKA